MEKSSSAALGGKRDHAISVSPLILKPLKRYIVTALSMCLQEEDCQENYIKNCFIEYGQTAQNVTVTVCRTPLVKDCDKPGEEVATKLTNIR